MQMKARKMSLAEVLAESAAALAAQDRLMAEWQRQRDARIFKRKS